MALSNAYPVALMYFFLLGAIVPVITYYLTKIYPNSFWRYVKYVR